MSMRKPLLVLAALLAASSLSAAPYVDVAALKAYAGKALPRCPDSTILLEPISQSGPTNFVVYSVELKSSDIYCGQKKWLMYSPRTQQVVLGTIITLPDDPRPVAARVTDQATQMLNKPINTTVAPFPLPDGLKAVSMTRGTEFGPFSYHGYVDASERYLIIGLRGNLQTDPRDTLRQSLGLDAAARRGNKASKTEIIEMSDFQCPTCGRAHKKLEPLFAQSLGKANFLRLDLPLFEHHEWAVPAALGARAIQRVAPAKYWSYVDFVFSNQDQISAQESAARFEKVLKDFCEDHDIDWTAVQKIYASPQERQALLDQVSRAFDAGIVSTPTFLVNGQILGFGPEGSFTYETLRAAINGTAAPKGSAPAKPAKAKTAAKKPAR